MSEETTFRHLKRLPIAEMERRIDEALEDPHNGVSPVYKIGNIAVERSSFYNPFLARHYQLAKALEAGGWTLDEYTIEMEKKAIVEQVKEFNDNMEFPDKILERAKRFFPNMKFTPAKLELE